MDRLWRNVNYTYDDLIKTEEYKDLLKLGLKDVTTPIQKKHLTLQFVDPLKSKEYYATFVAGVVRKIAPSPRYSTKEFNMWILKRWKPQQYKQIEAISFDDYKLMFKYIKQHYLNIVQRFENKINKNYHKYIFSIFDYPEKMSKIPNDIDLYSLINYLDTIID